MSDTQNQSAFDPSAAYQAAPAPAFDPGASYQPAAAASAPLTEQDAASGAFANQQAQKTVAPMQQNTLANVVEGVKQSAPVQIVNAAANPPESADEHIAAIAGPGALLAYRQAKGVVSSVKSAMSSSGTKFVQAVQDVKRASDEFHRGDYRNAASSAVSAGADVTGLVDPVGIGAGASDVRALSEGARPGGNLATPLTRQAIDAGTAAVGAELGGEAAGDVAEGATQTAGNVAGKVSDAVTGEGAQSSAQSALRQGVKAAGGTGEASSLRTIAEEPIHALESSAKSDYMTIDKAAGTDFKALNDKLRNTEYQLRQLTETEEDVAKEAKLETSRAAIMDKIEAAKQQAITNGVDPALLKQADAKFTQARALDDLEGKVFKNPNIVSGNEAAGTPETVNVDSAVKALQKLQDTSKFGSSRLEQALGKQGAQNLLKDMYAAQRAGVKVLSRQQMVAKIAKWTGITTGAVGGAYELLKK